MDNPIAVVDGLCKCVVELLIEFVVGIDGSHGEKETAQALLEEEPVLFVGNGPPYFPAHVVECSLSRIEDSSNFFLEDFELAKLGEPLLARLLVGFLEVYSLLHQLDYFLIQKGNLDHLALPRQMLTRTVGAHQDILLLEAHDVRAYLMSLQIMLWTHLRTQDLHTTMNKINTFKSHRS